MRSKKDADMLQDTVDFSFVRVEKEDAAKYWCQYRVLEPPGTPGKSDRVKLLLTSEGSEENGGPGLFPQGHVPLVSPLCTQITGTPHPAFPSALGGTARDWPPAGFYSIDHDSLGPAIQSLFYPVEHTQIQTMGIQLLHENVMGDSVKALTEVQVDHIDSLTLIH